MLFRKAAVVFLGLATFTEALSIREEARLLRRQNKSGFGGNNGNNNAAANGGNNKAAASSTAKSGEKNNATATATCLNANAIQTGSQSDGQNPPVSGQAASATDNANFVNFCSGQTLTNGLQTKGGSCNGIGNHGKDPFNPEYGLLNHRLPQTRRKRRRHKDSTISVQTSSLTAGSFTNAAATYYAAPQNLAVNGQIIGHTHVTVQDMGNSLTPTTALDPNAFVFFKGINDAGNGKGLLSATVTGGLPAGNYRVCSMSSSSNHQPVLMPIAQRGAQDDCQKFTVGGNANAATNNAGNVAASKASTTSAKAAATSKAATGNGGNNNGGNKNNAFGNFGKGGR